MLDPWLLLLVVVLLALLPLDGVKYRQQCVVPLGLLLLVCMFVVAPDEACSCFVGSNKDGGQRLPRECCWFDPNRRAILAQAGVVSRCEWHLILIARDLQCAPQSVDVVVVEAEMFHVYIDLGRPLRVLQTTGAHTHAVFQLGGVAHMIEIERGAAGVAIPKAAVCIPWLEVDGHWHGLHNTTQEHKNTRTQEHRWLVAGCTGFAGVCACARNRLRRCVCKEARTHLSTPLRRLLDAAEDLALCTTTPAAH